MQEGGDWVQDAKDKATTAFKTLADKGVAAANKAITTGVAAANTAISVNPLANKAKQMAEQLAKHGAQAQSALQTMGVSVPSVTTAPTAASTEPAEVVVASPSVSTEQVITTTPADTATVVTPSATTPEPTAAVTPSATAVVTEGTGTVAQFDHIVNALNALDQKLDIVVQRELTTQHAGGNSKDGIKMTNMSEPIVVQRELTTQHAGGNSKDGIKMTNMSEPIVVSALQEDLKSVWREFFNQYITTLNASMRSINLLEANNTSADNKQSLSQIYQSILELIKTLNNSGSTIVGKDIVNEDAIQQIEQFVTNIDHSEVPTPTFTQAEQADPETISTVAIITSMGLAAVALLGGSNSKQTQEGGYKHRHHRRKHRHHKRD
jgi:hypothetical protein